MAHWAVDRGYGSMAELPGEAGAFDVISICSPTPAHHTDALAALALRPRLLFCEKPMCADVALAQDLDGRCKAQGVLLAVNHNRRWDPEVANLRAELAAGAYGEVRSVACHYNKGILNNGSHMIDLLHDLLGPLQLQYAGTPVADVWPADPSVPAWLTTEAGVPVSLNCGHAADYSLFELQIVTARAIIAMEDGGLRWRVRMAAPSPQFAGYKALPEGEVRSGGYLRTMTLAVANIHDALAVHATLASTGDTALAAQRLCEAILRAGSH